MVYPTPIYGAQSFINQFYPIERVIEFSYRKKLLTILISTGNTNYGKIWVLFR